MTRSPVNHNWSDPGWKSSFSSKALNSEKQPWISPTAKIAMLIGNAFGQINVIIHGKILRPFYWVDTQFLKVV